MLSFMMSLCAPVHSQSESESRPGAALDLRLSVRVYNSAQVPSAHLAQAETIAAEVLGRANVEVIWTDCTANGTTEQRETACRSPFRPTHLALAIADHFAPDGGAVRATTLGYAVIPGGLALGHSAQVSLQRAEVLASQCDVAVELVLGLAMAHEIAHLLLGSNSHSAAGLMCERWESADLELATRGQLQLSARQSQQIQANLRSRWEQQLRQQARAAAPK